MSGGSAQRAPVELERDLLAGDPLEVLARIVPEDPLGLRPRITARLRARALLCDAESALLRAQALCAARARRGRAAPELARWLDQQVEEVLSGPVEDGDPCAAPREPSEALVPALALDAADLSDGCARFNRLPFEQREVFCALVLDGVSPDRLARERGLSLPELLRRARAGLGSFEECLAPRSARLAR